MQENQGELYRELEKLDTTAEPAKRHEQCARVTAGVMREFMSTHVGTGHYFKEAKAINRLGTEFAVTMPYMEIAHTVAHRDNGFMSDARRNFWVEFFQTEGISPLGGHGREPV